MSITTKSYKPIDIRFPKPTNGKLILQNKQFNLYHFLIIETLVKFFQNLNAQYRKRTHDALQDTASDDSCM